jgi:hypothetical protein
MADYPDVPLGEEREVTQVSGVAIDGAPVAYIMTLAAVVTTLAFIPLSIVLGGKSFPLSQAVYPLVGWILGPVAGPVASGIGALVGTFVAPHTSTFPLVTVVGAVVGSLTAGVMAASAHPTRRERAWWWVPLSIALLLAYGLYMIWAWLRNGVAPYALVLGSFINWSALLLWLLPTRTLAVHWMHHEALKRVTVGVALGTWVTAGLSHMAAGMVMYFITNWPQEIWLGMAALAPLEHLIRTLVGTIISVGVIAGLRATGLVKPRWAGY